MLARYTGALGFGGHLEGAYPIPDLSGRTVVVTGASSGLGLILTQQLALHGATVLMAVCNPAKGEQIRQELLLDNPEGALEVWPLDLKSVRSFAAAIPVVSSCSNFAILSASICQAGHRYAV